MSAAERIAGNITENAIFIRRGEIDINALVADITQTQDKEEPNAK